MFILTKCSNVIIYYVLHPNMSSDKDVSSIIFTITPDTTYFQLLSLVTFADDVYFFSQSAWSIAQDSYQTLSAIKDWSASGFLTPATAQDILTIKSNLKNTDLFAFTSSLGTY